MGSVDEGVVRLMAEAFVLRRAKPLWKPASALHSLTV